MIDHLSIQCADVASSRAFYEAVLAPLGGGVVMAFEEGAGQVVGLGAGGQPPFWLGPLTTGEPNREIHVAFCAADRGRVHASAAAAAANAAGAEVLHAPKEWPEYHPNYYGAFVRDPDGNNVEAVSHTPPS